MRMPTHIITETPQRGADVLFARVRAIKRGPQNRRERALALFREYNDTRTIAIAGGAIVATAALAYTGRRLIRRRRRS